MTFPSITPRGDKDGRVTRDLSLLFRRPHPTNLIGADIRKSTTEAHSLVLLRLLTVQPLLPWR